MDMAFKVAEFQKRDDANVCCPGCCGPGPVVALDVSSHKFPGGIIGCGRCIGEMIVQEAESFVTAKEEE